jgi:putative ABC transport system substrate-binding protein
MHFGHLKRREFVTLLGGTAAAWPVAARAQQGERIRRIGVQVSGLESDPEMQARLDSLRHGLERVGWSVGRNILFDYRFSGGDPARFQSLAQELVSLRPDVLVAFTTPVAAALQRQTRTIPIVFVNVSDPIGSGLIADLARPGGNLTGLLLYEEGITGKWLALLKEIAPALGRAALIANPGTTPYEYFVRSARIAAASLAIVVVPTPVTDAADVERAITSFAREPNGGLVLLPSATVIEHRDLVITLAARHRVPAVYPFRFFVSAGGLMSYGTDLVEQHRQVAFYVDRILRGASAADLPVQAPTKYETVLNLRAAKALGLEVPPTLLVRADEVIE